MPNADEQPSQCLLDLVLHGQLVGRVEVHAGQRERFNQLGNRVLPSGVLIAAVSVVEFYMLPEEQRALVEELLRQEGSWAFLHVSGGQPSRLGIEEVATLSFARPFQIYIGNRELRGEPVWRETAGGQLAIDFPRSCAAQLRPGLLEHDVLLEGTLGIMKKTAYEEIGIDPKPIQKWFRGLKGSLERLGRKDVVLVQRTTSGELKRWESVVVSPGAAKWHASGKQLKQHFAGTIKFDLTVG